MLGQMPTALQDLTACLLKPLLSNSLVRLDRALASTPEVDHANRDQKKAKIETERRQDHGCVKRDCDLRDKRSRSVRVAA